ncbi:MAG: leucine-rich repeat domain-containing protein, partial [Bacteroidota bacterium]
DTLGQLHHLDSLYLHGNQFTSFPMAITQLHQLTELTLLGNQITEIPTQIAQLKQLKRFTLQRNPLSPKEIQKIRTLLPHCKIYF